MRPCLPHVLAAALVLFLCRTAEDQGVARVVLDSKDEHANPGVDGGGHHLPPQPPKGVPYSLIAAIASEGRWLEQCAMRPWILLKGGGSDHHAVPQRSVPIHPDHGMTAPRLP